MTLAPSISETGTSLSSSLTNIPVRSEGPAASSEIGTTAEVMGFVSVAVALMLRVGVGGVAFGSISLYQQRLGALAGGVSLYSDADLSLVDSPLQLSLGPTGFGDAHRGAVAGNIAFCTGSLLLASVIGMTWYRLRHWRLEASYPTRGVVTMLLTALQGGWTLMRLPGSWLATAVVPLIAPTVLSSTVLLVGGTPIERAAAMQLGWRVADVVIGASGLFCSAAALTAMARRLLRRGPGWFEAYFQALPQEAEHLRRHANACASMVLLHGSVSDYGVWHDSTKYQDPSHMRKSNFTACYGLLFDGCRRGRQWWPLADAVQSVIVAIATGGISSSSSEGAVHGVAWSLAASQVIWVGLHFWAAPFRQWADRVTGLLLCVLCAAAAVIVAVASDNTVVANAGTGLSITASCIALAGSLVPLMVEMHVLCMLSQKGFPVEGLGRSLVLQCVMSRTRQERVQVRPAEKNSSERGLVTHQQIARLTEILERICSQPLRVANA